MKNLSILFTATSILLLSACGNDDMPVPVNEDEVITTVIAEFTPQNGGGTIILSSRDFDGDGPDEPVVTVSGEFLPATTYNGEVIFRNELASPPENLNGEIEEEGEEHQVFFLQNGLGMFQYTDEDASGNPVGLSFIYTTAATPMTGDLGIVLRHEPNKDAEGVASGNMTNAGGSTDAEVSFTISITE